MGLTADRWYLGYMPHQLSTGSLPHLPELSHTHPPLLLSVHPFEHDGLDVVSHLHLFELSVPEVHLRSMCSTHVQPCTSRTAPGGHMGLTVYVGSHVQLTPSSEKPVGQFGVVLRSQAHIPCGVVIALKTYGQVEYLDSVH